MAALSVLVVSYNVRDLLDACLASVLADAQSAVLGLRLLVVDKSRQRLVVLRYLGEMMIEYEYPCATGMQPGNKETAGDERTLESTRAALRSRGLDEVSREVEAQIQSEVKSLVSTGAQKAHAGDFDGAVAEMMNAARKMPGNPHVLFNAALALLRHIENRGWNDAFASQAHSLIERAQRLSPANPRLTAITEFMHELMKRFGIGAGRTPPKPRQA